MTTEKKIFVLTLLVVLCVMTFSGCKWKPYTHHYGHSHTGK